MKYLIFLFLSTQAIANSFNQDYLVKGQHSQHGSYSGRVQIRSLNSKQLLVTRVVDFDNLKFEGLNIQEVWQSQTPSITTNLNVTFNIKQADFMTRLGSINRSKEQFAQTKKITVNILDQNEQKFTFSDSNTQTYIETWLKADSLSPTLYQEQKSLLAANHPITGLKRLAFNLFSRKLQNDPFYNTFENRSDFKEGVHYWVLDPTDFNFYQSNQSTLRIVNKSLDEISYAESIPRRNAYHWTLKEKARAALQDYTKFHMNELGFYSIAETDQQKRFKNYVPEGDGALWTGAFVAAEYFRYQVTKDPEALDNIKKSVEALFLLMDVTGDPSVFARYVMPLNVHSEAYLSSPVWRRGAGAHADKVWIFEGNNDMYKGLVLGLYYGFKAIPQSDADFHNKIKTHVPSLMKLKIALQRNSNMSIAVGLNALVFNSSPLKEKYQDLSGTFILDTSLYVSGIADWSGLALGVFANLVSIPLTKDLGLSEILEKRIKAFESGWRTIFKANRPLINIVTAGLGFPYGYKDEADKLDSQAGIERALWSLREIPFPRPQYDATIDYRMNPNWCISPIPRLPWKIFKEDEASYFYQGIYNYPAFELPAYSESFIWKAGAFRYEATTSAHLVHPSLDFLFAYWLARFYNLIDENEQITYKPR